MRARLKYILPLAALLVSLTMFEAVKTYQANKDVSHLAGAIGDYAAQSEEVCEAEIDVLKAYIRVWESVHDTRLNVTLLSYELNEDERLILTGTHYREKLEMDTSVADLKERSMLTTSSGVVAAIVEADYRSNVPLFSWRNAKIRQTFLLKPRRSANVPIGCKSDAGLINMMRP